MQFIEILKVILLGIIEGITEWLPVSSTGHIILVDKIFRLNQTEQFKSVFYYFIQLGAILAVVILFFKDIFPWKKQSVTLANGERKNKIVSDKSVFSLWGKILVGCLPCAIVGILFEMPDNALVIALALIVYGVAFMLIEKYKKGEPTVNDTHGITYKTALLVGAFQMLSLIPGTSRSGATILGAMLLGLSRSAAAEFSFFLAIPTMLGASLLRGLKFFMYVGESGVSVPASAWVVLAVGTVTAFVVSMAAIKFLTDFVKKHSFSAFGVYRIVLGALVFLYFLVK
jgi:undecaprenyl-diphosphatase